MTAAGATDAEAPAVTASARATTAIEIPAHARELTATERLLLGQDSADRPMVIRVRLRFDGPLDKAVMQAAADAATRRHPMLRSVVRGNAWTDAEPADDRQTADTVAPMPLRRRTGVRMAAHDTFADVDVHHAACDGQGARQWIVDMLVTADALARGVTPELPTLDPARLALRGDLSHPPGVDPITGPEGMANLRLTTRGRTARLRGRGPARLLEHPFSDDETAAVRAGLAAAGRTMNDAGVIAAFRTLLACDDAGSPTRLSRGRLTVLNPVDIRRPADLRMPAANKVGFAYLRRTREECTDGLEESVLEQLRYVKDRFAGAEFVRGVEAIQNIPGAIGLLRRLGKFVPTCQFTCLGDATRGRRLGFRRNDAGDVLVGDQRLVSISGFAPLAPGVPLSLAACETATSLTLTAWSTLPAAEELLGRFAAELRAVATGAAANA